MKNNSVDEEENSSSPTGLVKSHLTESGNASLLPCPFCGGMPIGLNQTLAAFHHGVDAAKAAIRSECAKGDDEDNYYRAACINVIARKCGSPVSAPSIADAEQPLDSTLLCRNCNHADVHNEFAGSTNDRCSQEGCECGHFEPNLQTNNSEAQVVGLGDRCAECGAPYYHHKNCSRHVAGAAIPVGSHLTYCNLDPSHGGTCTTRDDWCDDCHGYEHTSDCPSFRRKPASLAKQLVDAVYRSMEQYEDGTWLLDQLRAEARVRKLLAAQPPAPVSPASEVARRIAEKILGLIRQHNEMAGSSIRLPTTERVAAIITTEFNGEENIGDY